MSLFAVVFVQVLCRNSNALPPLTRSRCSEVLGWRWYFGGSPDLVYLGGGGSRRSSNQAAAYSGASGCMGVGEGLYTAFRSNFERPDLRRAPLIFLLFFWIFNQVSKYLLAALFSWTSAVYYRLSRIINTHPAVFNHLSTSRSCGRGASQTRCDAHSHSLLAELT
jgi:hypothetical protein